MLKCALKSLLSGLADFVVSDRADLLARQLTAALDEVAALRSERDAFMKEIVRHNGMREQAEAELTGLRVEHERQRGQYLAALSELSTLQRHLDIAHDWGWAKRQLAAGKAVTHPLLHEKHLESVDGVVSMEYRMSTPALGSMKMVFRNLDYPGTVGWRLVELAPAATTEKTS